MRELLKIRVTELELLSFLTGLPPHQRLQERASRSLPRGELLPRSLILTSAHWCITTSLHKFMSALPAGIVTRRDGPLNIAAHSPINSNVPDLGPKGYWSQISNDAPGGQGSTKLHSTSVEVPRHPPRSLADLLATRISFISVFSGGFSLSSMHAFWYFHSHR